MLLDITVVNKNNKLQMDYKNSFKYEKKYFFEKTQAVLFYSFNCTVNSIRDH
jgi:hypothetical protein